MVKGIKKKRTRTRRELKKTVVANRRRNKDEERNCNEEHNSSNFQFRYFFLQNQRQNKTSNYYNIKGSCAYKIGGIA